MSAALLKRDVMGESVGDWLLTYLFHRNRQGDPDAVIASHHEVVCNYISREFGVDIAELARTDAP